MLFQPRRIRPRQQQHRRARWNDGPRLSATDPTVKWCISLDHENERRRRRRKWDGKKSNNKFIDRRATRYKTRRWRGHVYTYGGSDVTGHIYTHEYEEKKNGLRWHVRRFRFVPSACYATAAMGICTRKNEKNKMAVSFVCNVCVDDEDDFGDEITRVYNRRTDVQTDRQTDRHIYTYNL